MNTSFLSTATTLLLALTLAGCSSTETNSPTNNTSVDTSTPDAQYMQKLEQLNRKNPVNDAQQAIANGKKYFLCNAGRSRTVPGLELEQYTSARQNCPTQCLDGVTDAVLSDNHLRYLQTAITYSASWNKVMINVCQ